MKNLRTMLGALSAKAGSDYKAAIKLGVTHVTFGRWKKGSDFPADANTLNIAEQLGIDPRYALAIVQRDRAKVDQVKQIWAKIAEGFAVLVLSIGAASFATPAQAGGFNNNQIAKGGLIHIGPQRRKGRWTDSAGKR